ncbi:MAG: hypothetical protein ABJC07_05205 [Acidobacteriota bacterium]
MIDAFSSSTLGPGIRVTNGDVEIVAATGFGPRIVRFAFPEGDNALGEWPDLSTDTALGRWRPRGGHRLWFAPETMPESYAPDDAPVEHRSDGSLSLTVSRRTDAAGIGKEITVTLPATGAEATLTHRITNRGPRPVTAAAWALTIVSRGGVALLPSEPWRSHDDALDAARPFVLWSFTELADPRWEFGPRSVLLRSDAARPAPQKAGAGNTRGWCACLWKESLFVKRFDHLRGARYPDFGCNNEIYAAGNYMELESLGVLAELSPGASVEHKERWSLHQTALEKEAGECSAEELESAIERAAPELFG